MGSGCPTLCNVSHGQPCGVWDESTCLVFFQPSMSTPTRSLTLTNRVTECSLVLICKQRERGMLAGGTVKPRNGSLSSVIYTNALPFVLFEGQAHLVTLRKQTASIKLNASVAMSDNVLTLHRRQHINSHTVVSPVADTARIACTKTA